MHQIRTLAGPNVCSYFKGKSLTKGEGMRTTMILTTAVLLAGCGSKGDAPATSEAAAAIVPHSAPLAGTYSPNQINSCSGGDCQCMAASNPCIGIPVFGDVTIYGPNSATFYNSVTESVSFDDTTGVVTLTSNTTGHLGFSFLVEQAQQANRWKVVFSQACCRLYDKVF